MEYKQSKIRLFIASAASVPAILSPALINGGSEWVFFTGFACGVIAISIGIWMLVFADKKVVSINGLDLLFRDSGGVEHKFAMPEVNFWVKIGFWKTLEIKSEEKVIRITSLEFGEKAFKEIHEYVSLCRREHEIVVAIEK